ncbi:hypothetical protein E2C01_054813 [Portunus trituberculatus]|uniref:Uncharacterized protein n=1 Tax=Portunus trituberculatus TaxID=210409 RepID=A0A5B7GUY6_PORTR|nr:hypothetical protein [Portunus trituberculatus]
MVSHEDAAPVSAWRATLQQHSAVTPYVRSRRSPVSRATSGGRGRSAARSGQGRGTPMTPPKNAY